MKKIGIIGAMSVEIETLLKRMENVSEICYKDIVFTTGYLNRKEVVIVPCSIGKVNAAIITQILIDRFEVDAVINTGIAGSFDSIVRHLDVVISNDATYYDVRKRQMINWYPKQASFKADDSLIEAARKASNGECHIGTVLTGDDFIDSDEKKSRIAENFEGLCVEMEGAAIAHACFVNKVPYVILRCISDMADGSAVMDYDEFEQIAAHKSADIVTKMMEMI